MHAVSGGGELLLKLRGETGFAGAAAAVNADDQRNLREVREELLTEFGEFGGVHVEVVADAVLQAQHVFAEFQDFGGAGDAAVLVQRDTLTHCASPFCLRWLMRPRAAVSMRSVVYTKSRSLPYQGS